MGDHPLIPSGHNYLELRFIDIKVNVPTWLSTPDYRRVARFKKSPPDIKPSVFVARMAGGTGLAEVSRTGRGKANWPTATPT